MKTSAAPGRAPTPAPNSVTNPAPNSAPMPLVSIITPCRNAEAFIGAAIDSVCAQTLTDWEMLIVVAAIRFLAVRKFSHCFFTSLELPQCGPDLMDTR